MWHLTNGMCVSRQQRPSQQLGGGLKLSKNQNIRVCFVFKLVRVYNRNFCKDRGPKVQLNLFF